MLPEASSVVLKKGRLFKRLNKYVFCLYCHCIDVVDEDYFMMREKKL